MNNKLRVWFTLIYSTYTVSLNMIVVFTMFVFFNLIISTNPNLIGNNAKKFRLDIITGVQIPVPLLVYVSLQWLFSFRLSIHLIYPTYTVSLIMIVVFTIFVFFNLIMSTNPSLTGNNAKKFRLDIIIGVQTLVPLLLYVSLQWLFSFRLLIQVKKKSSIFYFCQKAIDYLLI